MGIVLVVAGGLGILGGILMLVGKGPGGTLTTIGGAVGIGTGIILFWVAQTVLYAAGVQPITPIFFTCTGIILSSGITGLTTKTD